MKILNLKNTILFCLFMGNIFSMAFGESIYTDLAFRNEKKGSISELVERLRDLIKK